MIPDTNKWYHEKRKQNMYIWCHKNSLIFLRYFNFITEKHKKIRFCGLYCICAVTIVDVRFSMIFPSNAKSTYNTWYQTKINDTTRSAIKICIWCDKNSLIFLRYFNFIGENHKKIRFCGLYCICAVTIVDVRFSMIFPSNGKSKSDHCRKKNKKIILKAIIACAER